MYKVKKRCSCSIYINDDNNNDNEMTKHDGVMKMENDEKTKNMRSNTKLISIYLTASST
jgi:hypothetical protein